MSKLANIVVASGCALLLAGCMHATRPAAMQHYGLGQAVAAPLSAHQPAAPTRGVLHIERLVIPVWLTGDAMYYRLDYRDGATLATYAQSKWIAPPANLLEPIIQGALARTGSWRAVTGPGSSATADFNLRIRLHDFSQVFSQPHDSAVVIDVTATLIRNPGGKVAAQRHFHVERAASGANARGGAEALGDASRELAALIDQWLQRPIESDASAVAKPQP